MARLRIESGIAHGRGFSSLDSNGLCAKITSFMKRPVSNGTPAVCTFDSGTDNVSLTSHGYANGDSIIFTTTGTLPAQLTVSTEYYVIYVDADTFQIATTYDNAKNATEINLTDVGTGTHSVYKMGAGAGWFINDDMSDLTPKTFATTDVNTSTEEITITGHGLGTGRKIVFSSTTTVPGGLVAGTEYYAIYVSANVFKVASSYANAYNATAINLTSQGTGTHTMTPRDPSIVFCDVEAPSVNSISSGPSGLPCRFLKLSYSTLEAGYIRLRFAMWHDSTMHFTAGIWSGTRVATLDDSDFLYNIRGGDELFAVHTLITTTYWMALWDEFVGDSSHLEGTDKYGVLQNGITAGSSVVLQLDSGEAANFTVDKYYYMYDFSVTHASAHRKESFVQYVKVTAVDTGTDQVTVENVSYNFASGAVIAAYAHRWYASSNSYNASSIENLNTETAKYPYCSAYNSGVAGYSFHNQTGSIYGAIAISYLSGRLTYHAPGDEGTIAVQRPADFEYYRENSSDSQTEMNEFYGVLKNIYLSVTTGLNPGIIGRLINGEKFMYFHTHGNIFPGSGSGLAVLIRDEESES